MHAPQPQVHPSDYSSAEIAQFCRTLGFAEYGGRLHVQFGAMIGISESRDMYNIHDVGEFRSGGVKHVKKT